LADFHGDKAKKKKKKNQNGRFSKWPFFKIVNSQIIFVKISWIDLVLGLVGLIDAKGIDVAQPIWS
jgi:hypothetical protein